MDTLAQYAHEAWFSLTHLFSGPMVSWGMFEWFLVNMAIFIPLALAFPNRRDQPAFRGDMVADSIYWFGGPLLYAPIATTLITFWGALSGIQYLQGHGQLHTLPILLQAVLILLITDFLQYWAHRGFHASGLWKFHAIHHSSPNIDWLSSARFHPVNIILYSTTINTLVWTMGFSVEAFYILIPFNSIYSPLVHANLNWTYGPFKYVLASPVFHRWHHTYPEEGGNKNFAPTFPFLDLMFGTFYMPKGRQPEVFGTPHDPITGSFVGQMIYPFRSPPAPQPAEAPEAKPAA